ncbi:hypothetical protein GGR21_001295 [Dysgonomonas hofstadii]|uniref:Uncharacterized protein n=1 Tax=Dysgonomonas hofstadii TaxID=637886 RepID=A0A840CS92_9BACT|nr:hypothetical protein [Dysgonomonas hofstadii]MBB4035402.1 hypothetical protein [Dysgonomonas hofstadii]
MDAKNLIKNNWYSAVYKSGFSIIFQVTDIDNGSPTFCRKDGVIIDTLPEGHHKIESFGSSEPDYQ